MAEKANILTRSVKKSVQDDPNRVQLFDEETKERLQHMLKEKTPPSVSSARNIQSSNVSFDSRKSSFVHLRQQLESCVWVQCDNTECFKWRMVTEEELTGVTEDTKWFCTMNKNKDFASCSIPEEDTEWYDRAAKRVGLCYVKTPITEGSLVWAKMSGYCKWPGVVTKDPCNQLHCLYGVDKEPKWYHVEFLGGSHTHSWVHAGSVKLYTLHSSPIGHAGRKKRGRGGVRGRRKSRCFSSVVVIKQPEKKTYKNGVCIEEACVEAGKLLDMSNNERLLKCNYLSIGPVINTVNEDIYKFHEREHTTCDLGVKEKENGPQSLKTQQDVKDKNARKHKAHAEAQREAFLSPTSSDRPTLDRLEMRFTDSLLDHTKEEKLVLDVQMYQRNERAFEHDVLRFMKRNNVKYRGAPKWQNTSISLFQLFLAVHERGGYEKVCSQRGGWVQVYNELTEFNQSSGNCAKNYYKRNLYPYELYIRGKEFKSVLPSNKRKKRKTKEMHLTEVDENTPIHQNIDNDTNSLEEYLEKEWVNLDTCLDNSSLASEEGSVDLMEILGELENTGNMCCLEDEVAMNKAKLGIDITFYDQSPIRPKKDGSIREADMASEFGYGLVPETTAGAREVPNVSLSSQSCPEDQILHEMQALQDDIDLVAGEIDFS